MKDKVPTAKNHVDYLLQKGREKELRLQNAIKEAEKASCEGLTFHPNVTNKGAIKEESVSPTNVFENLYQHGKEHQIKKKKATDRPIDEVELQRDPEAFTFTPTIHEINHSGSVSPIIREKKLGKGTKRISEISAPENVRDSNPAV